MSPALNGYWAMNKSMFVAAVVKTSILGYFVFYVFPPVRRFIENLTHTRVLQYSNIFQPLQPILGSDTSLVHIVVNSILYLIIPIFLWVLSSSFVNKGFQSLSEVMDGESPRIFSIASRLILVAIIIMLIYYYVQGINEIMLGKYEELVASFSDFKFYLFLLIAISLIIDSATYIYLSVRPLRIVKIYGRIGIWGCALFTIVKLIIFLGFVSSSLAIVRFSSHTVLQRPLLIAKEVIYPVLFSLPYIEVFLYVAILDAMLMAVVALGIITDPVLLQIILAEEGKSFIKNET